MIKTNILKTKKTAAVFMAVLMMIMSLSFTGNNADALNTTRIYKVYNAQNTREIGSYTLESVSTANTSRSVIGDDERVVDWTKSGVVKLMNSSGSYIGSGFVIDKHIIATAAHCIYSIDKHRIQSVPKILLFDNNGNVTMQVNPVECHIPDNSVTNSGINKEYDYALITVEEDLSSYACFDLGVPLDSFVNGSTNATVSVTGFPGYVNNKDVNTGSTHMMYTGNGKVLGGDENLIYYKADASGGNSGGPVYITESYKGKTYNTVVAVHTGPHNSESNHGTRITTDLINFYKSNDYLFEKGLY